MQSPTTTQDGRLGWRLLVPGATQWVWRQRSRALGLAIMFASSLTMGLFAWGSVLGCAFLLLAYLVHVTSMTDVLRQRAFPGFVRGVPVLSTGLALGVSLYLPIAAVGWSFAWPGDRHGSPREQYLVDRGDYSRRQLQAGERVFFRRSDRRGFDLGRVIARAGDEVEWSDRQLLVNNRTASWQPQEPSQDLRLLQLQVPAGHCLVAIETRASEADSTGWVLVPVNEIIGRPWAQSFPLHERRLLL